MDIKPLLLCSSLLLLSLPSQARSLLDQISDELIAQEQLSLPLEKNKEKTTRFLQEIQERVGLLPDGLPSETLLLNLQMLPEEQIERYAKFSDYLDYLKKEHPHKFIVVNLPSYTLKAYDKGDLVLESAVVVGSVDRPTPLITTNIVGIKHNPDWTPPPSIMKEDILPRLGDSKDTWITDHGIKIIDENKEEVHPSQLTATEVKDKKYIFRQPPGPKNALGKLKFETDNHLNIYLHDTNQKGLFLKNYRAKSSGCIRVKEWKALALFISEEPEDLFAKKLKKTATFTERTPKIPVIITYFTTDKINDKILTFPDIYHLEESDDE